MRKKTIIFLSYYNYPCSEPVLENVFAKEIATKSELIWIFQGNTSMGRKKKWHNSKVYLAKKLNSNKGIFKIIDKILSLEIYLIFLKILVKKDVDIVIVRDMPLRILLISTLAKIFKFSIYFQYTAPLGDLYIDVSKNEKNYLKFLHLFKGILFNLFLNKAIKSSSIIFPITNWHKNELSKYTKKNKIIPISMGIDQNWASCDHKEILFLRKLKKKYYLLVYFGSLSLARNIKFILRTFYKVKKKCSKTKLFLIGKTSNETERRQLYLYCKKLKIEQDVVFTGYLSKKKLRDYLKYFDLSICAIPPKNFYKISSPTKLYESLGLGLPVITNFGIYEQEKVIKESQGGLLVKYNTDSFCNGIIRLLNDILLREKMSKSGKNYVFKNYSYQKISENISYLF